MIGDDIKVVFTGGTSRHARVLVDAPKTLKIVRSNAMEKRGIRLSDTPMRYKKERELSPEAKAEIQKILSREFKKQRKAETVQE